MNRSESSAGREELCNKRERLEGLNCNLETNVRKYDIVRLDLQLCARDNTPIIRSLNNDPFSAIDLNKEASGASTFERIAENAVQGPEVYTEENFMILLELALNRPLNMVEKQVARDASAILRYALDRDDEDVDLTGLIKRYVQAENSWKHFLVLPINLMLFMLFAPAGEKEAFREDALRSLPIERKAIQALMDIR